jgi:hypothetical protein
MILTCAACAINLWLSTRKLIVSGVLRNVVDVGVDVGNEIPTEVGQLFDSLLPVLTQGFATDKHN